MKSSLSQSIATAILLIAFISASRAQGGDVYWHIDPSVKSCSMVIDPALTQAEWRTFVQQVGPISVFKSLAPAEPLGRMNFVVEIDAGRTPIDQHNPAWINTFVHPDAECPLGDEIFIPTLRARMGLTDRMDVGASWIKAPEGNYGLVSGEVKYLLSQESESLPATAIRGDITILTGVDDFNLHVYGIDLIASKIYWVFTPYVGLRGALASGTVTTSKVRLDTETLPFVQGFVGVSCSVWMMNLAAEYNVSHVNTFTAAVGFKF